MNFSSIAVLAIVIALAALAVRRCLKNGMPCECGCSRGECGCSCAKCDCGPGHNCGR